jgi:hypothetical protein
VCEFGSATDGVGGKLCLVPGLEGVDHPEGEADLGVKSADDQPLAPRRRHGIAERSPSNAAIDDRSIGSILSSSERIAGGAGLSLPDSTPTVETTIGTSNAFAVLISQRVWSSIRSAGVSDRIDSICCGWQSISTSAHSSLV